MKKLVFAFVAFLFVGTLSAQDHEKSYKKAKRLLGTYNLDTSDDSKLAEALEKIDYAMTGDLSDMKNPSDPYLVQGDIYNTIATAQISAASFAKDNPEMAKKTTSALKLENAPMKAYEAYKKALTLCTKGGQKKDALAGLYNAQTNVSNAGIIAYQDEKFGDAFNYFATVLEIHDLIKEKGGKSTMEVDSTYNNQLYLIGLAGLNAKKYAETKPYLKQLYDKKHDEPLIYTSLYAIEAETDPEAAYQYLEAGRKRYPNENSLLFEEINHFLKLGKLDELIGRLNKAIELEPGNVSLYTTLGNVYDNLYQKEVGMEGDSPKEKEYFDLAFKNYSIAVEKDPGNVDAHYSMGALYFNKAALVTQEMLKLNDDLTKEGMKKYDTFKAQSVELFGQALPHFKTAESLNANDLNTLIALKEIYARTDDIVKSNEFKGRMENVQAGKNNDTSYFNE